MAASSAVHKKSWGIDARIPTHVVLCFELYSASPVWRTPCLVRCCSWLIRQAVNKAIEVLRNNGLCILQVLFSEFTFYWVAFSCHLSHLRCFVLKWFWVFFSGYEKDNFCAYLHIILCFWKVIKISIFLFSTYIRGSFKDSLYNRMW